MNKKKTENKGNNDKIATAKKVVTLFKGETPYFMIGLLFVMFGVYLLLAFSSFLVSGGHDQSLVMHAETGELLRTDNGIQNVMGSSGAQLSQFLVNDCFGLASYIIIIFLIIAGMRLMNAYQFTVWKWFVGCFASIFWLSLTLAFVFQGSFEDSFIYPGGLHGYNVSRWIASQVGSAGLVIILLVTLVFICLFFSRETMNVVRKVVHPSFPLKRKANNDGNEEDNNTPEPENKPSTVDVVPASPVQEAPPIKEDVSKNGMDIDEMFSQQNIKNGTAIIEEPETKDEDKAVEIELDPKEVEPAKPIYSQNEQKPTKTSTSMPEKRKDEEPSFTIDPLPTDEDEAPVGDLSQPYNPRLDLENFKFPPLDLLNPYETNEPVVDMAEQNANKNRIIQVLKSFNIEISSIKASVGPTITLYEITPAEGIRIARIRNLEDDIALSLSALGIRIIAPIPGKGTIGIEVPNANPRIVPMSSILSSKKFQETKFDLPVALGRTITNEVFMVDLAKAPHMLVAGATGQGKSVGLNAIVTSLLYKKHPSELKFVIIDPKKVEFAIYAPIENHYLAKLPDAEDAIITDVTKVVQTLNSLCVEMDTRYDLLRKAGCRNIKEYNAKFINRQLNPNNGHRFLPYIVIIIDEFGDLIMTAGKDVELPICRIAQLARAVGIHAIIATQRPTTNIITGTIKANFPARVAFRVASMMDSRTILDRPGAQQLIGKGDLLYLQGNDPVRVQCAFVDTPEVERIATFISKQQGYGSAFLLPEYVDENADNGGGASGDVDMKHLDPLFEEAARLLIYHQQGSTSLIQRKFSIGYNRAGRIMDQLEHAGIVGPTNGSKAREVLCMDENDLDMRMSSLKN